MPRITYTPEGTETPYVFDFDFDEVPSAQAMTVERMTGMDWYSDIPAKFSKGNFRVIHALLFVFAKSRGVIPANTAPESFSFKGSEFGLDASTREAQALYDDMSPRIDSLTDEEAAAYAQIAGRDDVVQASADEPDEDAPEAPKG